MSSTNIRIVPAPTAEHFAAMVRVCEGEPSRSNLGKSLLGSGVLIHRQDRWWCATAAHTIKDVAEDGIRVLYSPDNIELSYFCPIRGRHLDLIGRDLAILELSPSSSNTMPPSLQPKFTTKGMVLGQTVWMLGYPRVPCPLGSEYPLDNQYYPVIKSGPLSHIRFRTSSKDDTTLLLLGAQGNKGYSGGAVVSANISGEQAISGIIIGTSAENKDRQLYEQAELTPVKEDAGFTWAVGIEHALEIIDSLS